jgi:SAM-dependent methyltransferase
LTTSQLRSARPRKDLALAAGTSAHYVDATYSTHNYCRRVADVAYYVKHAARTPGLILELGVGNGRIAIPLARAGHDVTGVDLAPAMLADLRRRLDDEPEAVRARVHLKRGDLRRVRLRKQYALIIVAFNTVLHLYSRRDVEQFFATVKAHLAPGGRLLMDLSPPAAEELSRDPARLMRTAPFRYPGVGRVRYGERFDYDSVTQVLHISMEFEPADKAQKPFVTPLCHRQFYPQEWEAYLHYNGFRVTALHGDFAGGPFDRESDTMIWHAKLRAPRAKVAG